MQNFLIFVGLLATIAYAQKDSGPKCTKPKSAGVVCKGPFLGALAQPEPRWYYNDKFHMCVSFIYNGCEGNNNNFLSKEDCEWACQPADGMDCAAGSVPNGKCSTLEKCPTGYTCVSGAFNRVCCEEETEKRFRDEIKPKCKTGKVYALGSRSKHPLLADSCDDLACPRGYKCIAGQLFAHCCPDAPTPEALATTVERNERFLNRQKGEVLTLMQQDPPEDPAEKEEYSRRLQIQVDVLEHQKTEFDQLLTQYEQLTLNNRDDQVVQNKDAWAELVYSSQISLAEAKQRLRTLACRVPQVPMAPAQQPVQNADGAPAGNQAPANPPDLTENVNRLIEAMQAQGNRGNGGADHIPGAARLPKLEIPKFDGNLQKWRPFWDRFSASIDSNPKLQDVDKLIYLTSLLENAPLAAIETLTLTNANYQVAVRQLKKRYGDTRMLVSQLYRQLSDLAPIRSNTTELRALLTDIDCLLGSLEALGQDTKDDNFATVILSKLPEDIVLALEIAKDVDANWSVTLLRDKLFEHLTRRERSQLLSAKPRGPTIRDTTGGGLMAGSNPPNKSKSGSKRERPKRPGPSNGEPKPMRPCLFCQGEHFHDQCTKYPDLVSRQKMVQGRCSICLSPKHAISECPTNRSCRHCRKQKSHHNALCPEKFGKSARTSTEPDKQGTSDTATLAQVDDDSGLLASGLDVVLQTASIVVSSAVNPPSGQSETVRSVLDSGATKTYCTVRLAKALRLKQRPGPTLTVNTFGSGKPTEMPTSVATLRVKKSDGTWGDIEVSVIPKITGQLSRYPVNLTRLKKLSANLKLADSLPSSPETGAIDLLLGNDYYLDFVSGEKLEVAPGLYLLGSEFGWILSGRVSTRKSDGYELSMCGFTGGPHNALNDMLMVPCCEPNASKKPDLSVLNSLETLGIRDSLTETSDEIAEADFAQRVLFEDGRYSVGLPFNDRKPELHSDYDLSLGRLKSATKRLGDNPELLDQYSQVFRFQEENGIIEKVEPDPTHKIDKHYLPHHAVVKPERETTKVRVVFDGSAKTRKWQAGLNECLHRGPLLLEDLAGLILRLRQHPIAVLADIEKAFLQIGIVREDRDYLRFLWLKDPKQPVAPENLAEYRFARVPFGLNCSPSLLAQTIRYHLQKEGSATALKILSDLYCDNVVTGVASEPEAVKLYTEGKAIFSNASMNLRCWLSNSETFMARLPERDKSNPNTAKVLGLIWKPEADVFLIDKPAGINPKNVETLRQMLSCVSSFFDPLGFVAPCLIQAKCILQSLHNRNVDWDQKIPAEEAEKWQGQVEVMEQIPSIRIPRYVPCSGSFTVVAFCDASSISFTMAIYLRSEQSQGVFVNLAMAKARVNPKKALTIPRLELLGILIAVRGLKFVTKHMRIPTDAQYLFCDSTIALSWLKQPNPTETFVRNRVREIRKSVNLEVRYVQTDDNPADLATRGKTPNELTEFWWSGPSWLSQPKSEWPTWDFPPFIQTPDFLSHGLRVTEKSNEISLAVIEKPQPPFELDIQRFSALTKLVRVTAWCHRAVRSFRNGAATNTPLSAVELHQATEQWVKNVQTEVYPSVIQALKSGKRHSMMQLGVFLDKNGILRCKGRLGKSNLFWDQKYPKLLPKNHPFTRLLVLSIHKAGHPSVDQTLILLRQRYWVPRGRSLVQHTVTKCVTCRKAGAKPYAVPLMPELPTRRVTPHPSFTNTGLDYFGPVKVKCCGKTQKAWVALFTCLSTRAIHLELVLDLTAHEFLLALKRFMARRGVPSTVLSDNAPQFKLVAKLSDAAWGKLVQDPEVCNFSANNGIYWSTIPEYAPYMGGVYERLVGLVKSSLRKTIAQALLSVKQFETALCECEALLNTRPLTHVGPNLDSNGVLTPAHFLSLNPRTIPHEVDGKNTLFQIEGPTAATLVSDWKKGQRLLDEFWKVWSSEYLNALRERNTYLHRNKSGTSQVPKVGQLILLKDQNLPRGAWKIGRISEISPSDDGEIRSVLITLPNGRVLRRPVSLLIPLEVDTESAPVDRDKDRNETKSDSSDTESEDSIEL